MAEKQTNKDRMREIVDSIENGIKELFESDKYQQYLSTMSRFHRYSVNNTMLIYMQHPDATHVAGFNKWRDQFGRNVLKGEKGIRIIAPTPYKKKVEEIKTDPETNAPILDADGKAIIEEKEIRMWKTYTLTLKGQMTHRVELGSDARGNLVRIENALDKMPERLRSVQEQLENLYNQQAAAKAEVGKPFPQEQELAAKTARLIELDMELNLDGKGQPQPEQAIAKSARPSVLDRLKAPPVHGAPEKPHKKEMEAR